MKIWYQYGSEHSANLVMIGHFKNADDATMLEEIINELTSQVRENETRDDRTDEPASTERFSNEMLNLLLKLNVTSLHPEELEQFTYDVNVDREGNKITIRTDDVDVSAFLKLMVLKGARIEVFSAHDYPDSENGRGRR